METFSEAYLKILNESMEEDISNIAGQLAQAVLVSENGVQVKQGKRYNLMYLPNGQVFFQFYSRPDMGDEFFSVLMYRIDDNGRLTTTTVGGSSIGKYIIEQVQGPFQDETMEAVFNILSPKIIGLHGKWVQQGVPPEISVENSARRLLWGKGVLQKLFPMAVFHPV